MIKAHKIRLNPTPEQEIYFRKAAGTARFVSIGPCGMETAEGAPPRGAARRAGPEEGLQCPEAH